MNRISRTADKHIRATRLPRELRAKLIKRAALQVLAENGIGHCNHSMVAAAAGVSLPTLFSYFGTAQALTDAVLDDVAEFLLYEIVEKVLKCRLKPQEGAKAMLLAFASSIDERRDTARVWMDWSTAIRDPAWANYLVFYDKACTLIAADIALGRHQKTVRAEIDPVEAARVIIGLAHMVAQMKFAGSPNETVDRAISTLLKNYLEPVQLVIPII